MKLYIKSVAKIKKIFLLALFASQALVLSIIESWLPIPVGIPGLKLGLANIVTIVMLIFFSLSDTLIVVLVRCVLSSLFIGGPVIFVFSICGGLLSVIIMWLLLKSKQEWLSLVGISIMGALVHNITQIIVACFIMNDLSVASYLPLLLITGIIMGSFVGSGSAFVVRVIKKLNVISNV